MTLSRVLQILVATNAIALLLQCVRVIAVYSAVYSLTTGPKRQLPFHVWLMATSYLIYVFGTTVFVALSNVPNAVPRLVTYLAAGVLGQYALYQVLAYDRRKYSKLTNFKADDERGPAS